MASPEEAQIIQMLGVLLGRLAGMEQLMSGRLDQVQQRLDRVEHLVSACNNLRVRKSMAKMLRRTFDECGIERTSCELEANVKRIGFA